MNATDRPTKPGHPYAGSLVVVAIAWSVGVAASWCLSTTGLVGVAPQTLTVVAIGSGLIAVASSIPGLFVERYRLPDRPVEERGGMIMIGFSAGVLIRLASTVALVGMCSYHLPATKTEIAGTILAWYVYLTTIDVAALATLLPRLDRRTTTPRS